MCVELDDSPPLPEVVSLVHAGSGDLVQEALPELGLVVEDLRCHKRRGAIHCLLSVASLLHQSVCGWRETMTGVLVIVHAGYTANPVQTIQAIVCINRGMYEEKYMYV